MRIHGDKYSLGKILGYLILKHVCKQIIRLIEFIQKKRGKKKKRKKIAANSVTQPRP